MSKKIVVGMSGGVDSSVALILLKKKGWEPVGVSLKLAYWKDECNVLGENACCTQESLKIAKDICKKLGIKHYTYDVSKDFQKKVICYFNSELSLARTPNPCVICNRHLKFNKLIEWADRHKIKYVASGHYAKTKYLHKIKKYQLLKPKDLSKDQTYGLSFLTQNQLARIIFPLGDFSKKEVYKIAKKEGFDFFMKKKQSQDLCFVSRKAYKYYLEKVIGLKKGKIVDENGNFLGMHKGLHFYTIGQKKGLYLPGAFFVKKLDFKKNQVVVTKNRQSISTKEIFLKPYNFISGELPKKKAKVAAKIRYSQELSNALLIPQGEKIRIIFKIPQEYATPGQFCVFYKGNACLGGGVIN